MKIPYIRWWIDDWIGGTSWMSRTERGAYHDLLMHQSANGPMSETMVRRILGADYNDVWPVIQCKFTEKNNLFFNEKMLSECQRVEEYSKSRSSNRRKNKGLNKKDMKNTCKTHEKHMGSGSGSGSGSSSSSSSGSGYVACISGVSSSSSTSTSASTSKKRKHKPFTPPTVEQVADYCRKRKNGVDAQAFVDFYASKGWVVGKSPMKNWEAAIRTWEKKSYNQAPQPAKSEPQIYY